MNKKSLSLSEIQQIHQAGRLQEAKAGYLFLLEENPDDVVAMHGLAILYAEEGNLDEAQQVLEKALKFNPNHLALHLRLANILKAKGLLDEAIRVLKHTIHLDPHFAVAFNNLGTIYFTQEKWLDAINSYQSAIDLQPDYTDAYYNLGLALNKSNQLNEAVNVFQALIELSSEHMGGKFQLGCLLMQQSQYSQAIDQFKFIAQAQPFHFETQTNLATCYLKMGRLNDAKIHYIKALDLMPNDNQVLFNLGVISMQQGQIHAAIEFYLRALKLNPNFEVRNNLAVAYLTIKQSHSALMHFREALRLQPNNQSIHHIINILLKDKNLTLSPPEYIRSLFDAYADHYDAHVIQDLNYHIPIFIHQIIGATWHLTSNKWDILDLGCGTGLCGEQFKSHARSLIGVDIAEKMLAIAAKKNIYDALIHADILSFLNKQDPIFDIVLAGDVLVYYGDLSVYFSAVFRVLRPNGIFAFNAEVGELKDYEITDSGRFSHRKDYLEQLIAESHFEILDYQKITMRTQNQLPVRGHLYLLKKQ